MDEGDKRDERDEIDEIDGGDGLDEGDEELVIGEPRPRHLGRSDLGVGLIVLAALGALGVATLHSSATPAARTTGSAAPGGSPASIAVPSPTPTIGVNSPDATFRDPSGQVPSQCPPTITCTSVQSVPVAMFDAVDSYLLGARPRSQYSVVQTHPQRLYYRQLTVTSGDVQLTIVVSRAELATGADSRPTVIAQATPDEAIAYVRIRTADGFLVQVQFTGPPGQDPPTAQARELAADPRLRVLS